MIHPFCESLIDELIKAGAGAAATTYEEIKRRKYRGKTNENLFDFLPFIMETSLGIGKSADEFVIELEEKRTRRACYKNELTAVDKGIKSDHLITALSFDLQRSNAEMILERVRPRVILINDILNSCAKVLEKTKSMAKEELQTIRMLQRPQFSVPSGNCRDIKANARNRSIITVSEMTMEKNSAAQTTKNICHRT